MPSSDPVARAEKILAWAEEDPLARSAEAQAKVRKLAEGLDPVPQGVLDVGHVLASMADAAQFLAGA
jgi:hypothetical protein